MDRCWTSTHRGGLQPRGITEIRTKTRRPRKVLLNDRALHALEKPRPLTEARSDDVFAPSGTDDRSALFIRPEASQQRYWLAALRTLGIRHRRLYDTRHTYATMCLVAGMNPAFIAAQLGHSVQVLLCMRQVDHPLTIGRGLISPGVWRRYKWGTSEKPVTP